MSSDIHVAKCEKIRNLIDTVGIGQYSRYIGANYDDTSMRTFIDDVARELLPEEWIFGHYNPFELGSTKYPHRTISQKEHPYNKPQGIWMSKGDWLFHDCGCSDAISLIRVDYTHIYIITNEADLVDFEEKYVTNQGVLWNTLSEKGYKGFVLLYLLQPHQFSLRNRKTNQEYNPFGVAFLQMIIQRKVPDRMWLCGYDVSSLVIWDTSCITAYTHLGDTSLIDTPKITISKNTSNPSINEDEYFIDSTALITRIRTARSSLIPNEGYQ